MNVMNKLSVILSCILVLISIASCDNKHIDNDDEVKINQNTSFPSSLPDDAVDLGLSVKWAPINVGATNPYEYGNYYAWGEIEPKENYSQSTYTQPIISNTSSNSIIATKFDVAYVKWGNGWRLPTSEELDELKENCSKEEITINGINGTKYTSKNGNSIFLPAAGYVQENRLMYQNVQGYYRKGDVNNDEYFGYSVRPVIDINNPVEITSVELTDDSTHLQYDNINSKIYINYHFKVGLKNNYNFYSNRIEVGFAIYRDGQIYDEIIADDDITCINGEIEATPEFLTIENINGTYKSTTKGHWQVGPFIGIKSGKDTKRKYSQELTDLNFTYERKPSIDIDSIDFSDLIKTAEDWIGVTHRGAHFSYDMIINGALFMNNGYEIVYNLENTGERTIYTGYNKWTIERYPSKQWALPFMAADKLLPAIYQSKYMFENDGRIKLDTPTALEGPVIPTFDSLTVATIQYRSIITLNNSNDTIKSPILKFKYQYGSGSIEKIDSINE